MFAVNLKKNWVYAWGSYKDYISSFFELSKDLQKPSNYNSIDSKINKCEECRSFTSKFSKSKYAKAKAIDRWQEETTYDTELDKPVVKLRERLPFEIHEEMK